MKKLSKIFYSIVFLLIFSTSASYAGLSLPKVGGDSGGGGNIDEAKTKFTQIFFESALNYMEAQFHLFNALEMNDEAAKTKKSIDFVKDDKKKEGKRLTNAFNAVSENSDAIESALTDTAATSAEAKAHYAKALPFAIKGIMGTIQLPPEAKSLLDTIKADKMAALKLKDFVKVLPKIPDYVKTATKVGKLVVGGAKSRDVKGAKDAADKLGDL